MTVSTQQRHYGMDWLRIGAFALLIFYHIGYSFTPWGYQTPTRGVVSWAQVPLLALSPWRLGLLFAISGYASAALLGKQGSNGAFLRSRLVRLGVPLLFGLIVVVPPQPYAGLINGGYAQSYGYYLLHDAFSFTTVRGEYLPRVMHLWFVIYLLAYTLAFCAALRLPGRWRRRIGSLAERAFAGPLLLPLGIALVCAARALPGGWTDSHGFLDDPAAHLHYGGLFLFGVLLRHSEPLRRAIAGQWTLALVLSVAAYLPVALDALNLPPYITASPAWDVSLPVARATQSWCMIVALFGIADRYWNHDARWRATLAEAVFPFYIVHQTVQVLCSYWLRDKGLSALPEFLALMAATTAGCWAFYLIGREFGPLRPLIGLGRKPKAGARTVDRIVPAPASG